MKPTEKELDANARAKFVEFLSGYYGTKNFSRDMDYDGSYVLPINTEWEAFEAGYYRGYEANVIEVVTGEAQEGDIVKYKYLDGSHTFVDGEFIEQGKGEGKYYTIIMRNGKVVLDKRENQ